MLEHVCTTLGVIDPYLAHEIGARRNVSEDIKHELRNRLPQHRLRERILPDSCRNLAVVPSIVIFKPSNLFRLDTRQLLRCQIGDICILHDDLPSVYASRHVASQYRLAATLQYRSRERL
jgi:hypothetical protein